VVAELRDANNQVVGTATFSEQPAGGVQVRADVRNLPPGNHGIHIHEVGRCDPPDFMSAGAHFNPTTKQHGLQNPQGHHAGDLPNLTVGADGTARFDQIDRDVTLGSGTTSLFDADGSSLVIHANPDDEMTDPSGNSGGRIACGIIRRS
jgi:Cu-Zn family superoxide dismutase